MKTTYTLSRVVLFCACFILHVSNISAQCTYNINSLGGSDLVNWNGFHISNVTIDGDNSTAEINNTNNNLRYTDYTSISIDMTAGNTYNFSILNDKGGNMWGDMKVRIWIDYNNDGNYTQVYDSGSYVDSWPNLTHTISGSFTVNSSAITGTARLRIQGSYCTTCGGGSSGAVISSDGCDFTNTYRGDVEDYTINITGASASSIDISGSGNSISSGSTTTDISNNTDFGSQDLDVAPLERSFVITNNGAANLTLTLPISDPSGVFTISDQPDNATIAPGNSEIFTVAFDPTSEINYSATVSVTSNDATYPTYTFLIEGEGTQIYPDTDGDGIPDTVDGDDDNDGILDIQEQLFCINSPTRKTTDVIFLNEDFGSGTTRQTISGASYCYEDGTGTCNGSTNLNDGSYVSYYKAANADGNNDTPNGEVASWADQYWYPGLDHTSGDTNGRMAMFNADYAAGVFYETTITGVTAGVDVTYGFSIINLDRADAPNIATRNRPSVLIEVLDPTNTVIASTSSGLIPPTSDYVTGDWVDVSATFNSTYTEFTVRLTNQSPGGAGNDLAIDDIIVKQTLCDVDEDGVADAADLDNDDDGIPNVVELGFSDPDKDGTLYGTGWIDNNKNGVHDSYETPPASYIDTDLDGVPDYLDPDSDNDGIFDAVEYDGKGDVDITGDGVGNGSDTEDYISKINNNDVDGDGILAIIDTNDDDADGDDFGSNYADPLDDDSDGIPNYRDVDSADSPNDFTNGSDIDNMPIYAHLDADNDGDIDGTADADQDGILDTFDTDNTVFGSPRDLNDSYTLFFDGRNDYVEEASVMSGWANATLMAWIKIEPGASGDRVILGQNNFNIMVTSSNLIRATANGTTLDCSGATSGIWAHIAAVYNSTDGEFLLYVNGNELATTTISGILPSDSSSFTLGRTSDTDSNYFEGEIDEVRVFSKALTKDELQRMIYQELTTAEQGSLITTNISGALTGTLSRYYKMDAYNDDVVSNMASGATMYNIKDIAFQTAPLPYETKSSGNWSDANCWVHGDVWDITSKQNNSDDTSIVHIKHNITLDGSYNTQGMIGLIVDSSAEFTVSTDKGLYNNWYLKLDGKIDLEGEAQLIQTDNSILDVTSSGIIERDQQGTKDLYTYNYWSLPVSITSTSSNNNSYNLASGILKNGTLSATPNNITFNTTSYNGSVSGTDISIADYWIWKYANQTNDDYSLWQHIRSTGTLNPGEGFTMKGVANTGGDVSQTQNYVFEGKPNNGDITLSISAGNAYLVGNPYPSALDADEFIMDNISDLETNGRNINGNIINGALYFWDHFGGSSHAILEYIGGYATYTLMGGVPAVANDARINNTGAIGTKTPGRYIPIGQGFFVSADTDSNLSGASNDPSLTEPIVGGNLVFQNSQRTFQTEATASSNFLKNNTKSRSQKSSAVTENREKIRLLFHSPGGYHREILVGTTQNTSKSFDIGYDAPLIEENLEDMFWSFENVKYIIQSVGHFNEDQALPIGIKTNTEGIASIGLEGVENIEANKDIYLHDLEQNIYHNLKDSNYDVHLPAGEHLDRFELVFQSQQSLSTNDNVLIKSIQAYYSNETRKIIVLNPNLTQVKSVELHNILGQSTQYFETDSNKNNIELNVKSINTGVYFIKVFTEHGSISKKILVE